MKVTRVRSSLVTNTQAKKVQVGEYQYWFETYHMLLARYKAHALSRARNTNATAHRLAKALACSRIVGCDVEFTGNELHQPRAYCRVPVLCLNCRSIAIRQSADRIATRANGDENGTLYSMVFTTPQPSSNEEELDYASGCLSGLQGTKQAIIRHNNKTDDNRFRVTDYAIGLHLAPREGGRLWSHVHLMFIAGPNLQVGNPDDNGLAAKLTNAFHDSTDVITKTMLERHGDVGAGARRIRRGNAISQKELENKLAYAIRINGHGDDPEVITSRSQLLGLLGNPGTYVTSRRAGEQSQPTVMKSLPNRYPPRNDKSETWLFSLSDDAPVRVSTSQFEATLAELLKEAKKMANGLLKSSQQGTAV